MTALSCSFPVGRSGTRPEAYHRLIPLNFGGNRASSSVFWRISAKASPLAQNVIATTAGVRMIETRRRPDCRRHGAKDGVRPAVRQGPALKPGSEPVLGAPDRCEDLGVRRGLHRHRPLHLGTAGAQEGIG